MSDFLVSLGARHDGAELLRFLKLPYGARAPQGECFEYAWGCAAVLHDQLPDTPNIGKSEQGCFAWVGDLVLADPKRVMTGLLEAARLLSERQGVAAKDLSLDPSFKKLNGAFACLLLHEQGPGVIVDPLGSVQVYAGRDHDGRLSALGTHPDLVALLAEREERIDPVSVFEFLNVGTPCFPHTMHQHVRELAPGRLHVVRAGLAGEMGITEGVWWPFPEQYDVAPGAQELAEVMEKAFAAAVRDRCPRGTVGVTLSGGLDSRLVMAAVPGSTPCIGFTFCDNINREARTARKVAECYGRDWIPLVRDEEYIARTAVDTVKFTGCEGDWVNAHGMGFVAEFEKFNLKSVLSGLLMNNNVKGFYAADVQRVPRWKGLLPPKYEIVSYDYVTELKPFSAGVFQEGLLEGARSRREAFLKGHPGLKRQSVAEWLHGYPFSQASDNTAWVAERRLMPVRLPAMDRRLLEVACRIPMCRKAGGELFARMAVPILAKSARIPNANDGVRPGSGHLWRLAQRAVRKVENNRREFMERIGLALPVPTSWHDYPRYWRTSRLLQQFISENGDNLQEFLGVVFRPQLLGLLRERSVPWENGFRLVQLGLWKTALRQYRTAFCRSGPVSARLAEV